MTAVFQPITISSIHWLPGDGSPVELCCPVCQERRYNPPLLEIPSLADASLLTMYSCSSCDSKFFDPPGIRDFSDILSNGAYFWKSYVEVAGGLWEMYWPAAVGRNTSDASLLDVGCGFGFTVDAWRRQHGEAVGVELAEYGRIGADQLRLSIYADYLQNIPELQTKRFDVVYASEVIEHVPDPREFAALLSRYVADDGVLCLTTPNAEFIQEKHASNTLVAALSPGFHGFLIGPDEMKKILLDCGFVHVVVRQFGARLIAWASNRPLDIDDKSPLVRAEYLRYLEGVLASRKENDFVTDGIAYRHFRDTVLAGQFDAARKSLTRLEASLQEKYPAVLENADQTLERIFQLSTSEDYNTAYPWFLPNFYYIRGIYAKLSEKSEQTARQYFRASRELTRYMGASWGANFVLEANSFVPDAWQQEAVSAAIGGDPSVCEQWIATITDGDNQNRPELCGDRFSNRQIELAFLESLSILSALKRPESLGKALRDCLQYLESRYGDWLRIEPTASQNTPGVELQHEQRMYLHFKIAATCIQLGSNADLIRPLLERVLQLGKMQYTPSTMGNWIIAEARKKLAALSPNPNPWGGMTGGAKPTVSYAFKYGSKTKL